VVIFAYLYSKGLKKAEWILFCPTDQHMTIRAGELESAERGGGEVEKSSSHFG
jgi:hypothetical protein